MSIAEQQQGLRQDIEPSLGDEYQMLQTDMIWHKIFGDFRIKQSCKFPVSHIRKQMNLVLLASVARNVYDFHELLRGHAKYLVHSRIQVLVSLASPDTYSVA